MGLFDKEKSDLLQLISGRMKLAGGRIRVFGRNPATLELSSLRSTIGLMPRDLDFHFQTTVGDILCFFGKLHGMSDSHLEGKLIERLID